MTPPHVASGAIPISLISRPPSARPHLPCRLRGLLLIGHDEAMPTSSAVRFVWPPGWSDASSAPHQGMRPPCSRSRPSLAQIELRTQVARCRGLSDSLVPLVGQSSPVVADTPRKPPAGYSHFL